MYRYWFDNIKGLTPVKKRILYETFREAEILYHAPEDTIRKVTGIEDQDVLAVTESKRSWNLEGAWMRLQERGISLVTLEDDEYPAKLARIVAPPYALYYRGHLPDESHRSVAIVGARGRSAYGSQVARTLAKRLAEFDVDIISGMALGIDTDGHMGALDGGGRTYAVLGCGVDICYPKSNHFLYEEIPKEGGILSEFVPGTQPLPMLFPQRNRIISGLSDYVIVIEARMKSGSLITADYAMEQAREVYALPGRITDELSQGCNHLIQQGAGVIASVDDFLKEMQLSDASTDIQMDFRKNLLEKDETLVYSLFDFHPLGLGSLVEKTPYSLLEVLDILERLQQKGFVKETIPNFYVKTI